MNPRKIFDDLLKQYHNAEHELRKATSEMERIQARRAVWEEIYVELRHLLGEYGAFQYEGYEPGYELHAIRRPEEETEETT